MRDRQSTPDTKSHHSQPTKEREAQRATAQEDVLATQQDPLTQVISRIGSASSASNHAAILNRLTASQPSQVQRSLLQLQRQRGNRYVQRVLAIARQGEGNAEVTPEVEAIIERKRGSGQGLESRVQAQMESAFDVDFSGVRVHTDSEADTLNQGLNARAFTIGQDIFFRQGEYSPDSSNGQKLLAHELTHVVQQTGGVRPKLVVGQPNDQYEQEADQVAEQVMGMFQTKIQRLCPECEEELQRQPKRAEENDSTVVFATSMATADGTVLEDEPFTLSMQPTVMTQGVTSQPITPKISISNAPVIQRAANFVAGTVNATTNMAAHIIASNFNAGFTPPTLNGTQILSTAAARGAIRRPTLGGRSNINGTVDTWVETVPTNEASFTMQVPSSGPWSTVTAKTNVAVLFALLGLTTPAGCVTAGNTTFSVNGKPTDAGFAANVRTHENLHAADHRTGFNSIIVPWDARLQAAQLAGTVFSGASVADAEAALFSAMGGTPDQIATAQFNEWIRLNNVTHTGTTLATGGPATPSNSAANATCTTSSLDVT